MGESGVEAVKPLDPEAVRAAVALAATLRQFTAVEKALRRLAAFDTDWSVESLIIKVSALDSLYATNLYGAVRMAQWIHKNKAPHGEWTIETVETIAALPSEAAEKPVRRCLSFASKFAHFFADPRRFPLYDQYSFRRLLYHVKSRELRWETTPRYGAYVDAVKALLATSKVEVSLSHLDCYLWLAGQWLVVQGDRRSSAAVGNEVREALQRVTPIRDAFVSRLGGV